MVRTTLILSFLILILASANLTSCRYFELEDAPPPRGPQIIVEGFLDPDLGIYLLISRATPSSDLVWGGGIDWITDAEVLLTTTGQAPVNIVRDTLGVYSLTEWDVQLNATSRLLIRTPLGNTEVQLAAIPPKPVVTVLSVGTHNLDQETVASISVTPAEGFATALGSIGPSFQDYLEIDGITFANGAIDISTGTNCRRSYFDAIASSGCSSNVLFGTITWENEEGLDTFRNYITSIPEGFVDYLDVHRRNREDWGSRSQLLYNIPTDAPSNVTGGLGYVRVQNSRLLTIPKQ